MSFKFVRKIVDSIVVVSVACLYVTPLDVSMSTLWRFLDRILSPFCSVSLFEPFVLDFDMDLYTEAMAVDVTKMRLSRRCMYLT